MSLPCVLRGENIFFFEDHKKKFKSKMVMVVAVTVNPYAIMVSFSCLFPLFPVSLPISFSLSLSLPVYQQGCDVYLRFIFNLIVTLPQTTSLFFLLFSLSFLFLFSTFICLWQQKGKKYYPVFPLYSGD